LHPHRIFSFILTLFWTSGSCFGSTSPGQRETSLRSLLRRFPFWAHGHHELGELALQTDQVALAYSSALSYQILSGRDKTYRSRAFLLLGRCFLRRGDPQAALHYLLQAQELGLCTPQLAEEIAAAHILQGSFMEAYEALAAVPANTISAEGKAALSFVKGKITTPHGSQTGQPGCSREARES
jgi:hypothetical protein